MAGNKVELVISADDKASKKLDKVSKKVGSLGGKLGGMAKTGVLAFAAITAAAVAAGTKMAIEFDRGMSQVRTLLPEISDKAFGKLNRDVLTFTSNMNVAANDATKALYDALSAGVPKENVLTFLIDAAKAATAGAADLTTAVGTLTQVVNVYGEEVINSQKASDILFTIIKRGVTTLPELSGSIGRVLPTAQALGVQFDDVGASLAVMTSRTGNTAESVTNLNALFVAALKGSSKLSAGLNQYLGASFVSLIAKGETTSEIMQRLRETVKDKGGGDDEFRNMFTRVSALNAALLITGERNAPAVKSALDEMRDSAGATNTAFGLVQESLSFQIDDSLNDVKISLLGLGQVALPAVAVGIDKLAGAVGFLVDAVEAFEEFSEGLSKEDLLKEFQAPEFYGKSPFEEMEARQLGTEDVSILAGSFGGSYGASYVAAAEILNEKLTTDFKEFLTAQATQGIWGPEALALLENKEFLTSKDREFIVKSFERYNQTMSDANITEFAKIGAGAVGLMEGFSLDTYNQVTLNALSAGEQAAKDLQDRIEELWGIRDVGHALPRSEFSTGALGLAIEEAGLNAMANALTPVEQAAADLAAAQKQWERQGRGGVNDMVTGLELAAAELAIFEEHQLSVNSQVSILKDDLGGLREASRVAGITFGATAEKTAALAAVEEHLKEAAEGFRLELLDGTMTFEDVQKAWAKQITDAADAIEDIRVSEENKVIDALEISRREQAEEAARQLAVSKVMVGLSGKTMEEIAASSGLVGLSANQLATVFGAASIRSIGQDSMMEKIYSPDELDEKFGKASATNWARATVEATQKHILGLTDDMGNYLYRRFTGITGMQTPDINPVVRHEGDRPYVAGNFAQVGTHRVANEGPVQYITVNIYGEVFYSDEVGQRIAEAINQAGVANGVGGVQMLTSSVT